MLGGTELVEMWEDSQELSSLERSMLLVARWPGADSGSIASVADLNRRILGLRSHLFGTDIAFYAECDQCGEPLEFTVDVSRLASEETPDAERPLVIDGREMTCRPPSPAEVLAAVKTPDLGRWLARQCVRPKQDPDLTLELSDEDVSRIEDWLRDHHPLLEITLTILCPLCEYTWDQFLDVDDLIWRDIDMEARRLLEDVDRLARIYGWDEADILAMSPQRRARYLELTQ